MSAFICVAFVAYAPGAVQAAPISPGQTCQASGAVHTANKATYICSQQGTSLKWSKPLRMSNFTLTVKDAWTKAIASGNTATFGMLTNPSNTPVTIVAAISPAAPVVQLHEVLMKNGSMVMQQKPGGFVIPAQGSLELKPGGNHLMLIGATKSISAGDMVPLTLIASNGARFTFTTMAKAFSGANESYVPAPGASPAPSMKM